MQRLGGNTVVRERAGTGRLATYDATRDDGRDVRLRVVDGGTEGPPEASTRLEEDLRKLSQLQHPGIDRPIEWSAAAPMFVSTAPSLSVSLRAACEAESNGRLSPGVAAWIASEVAAGLSAAHSVGVVHAGLSLDSVLIDAEGRVRVSDFGLMRCLNTDPSASASLTFEAIECLAPEQLSAPDSVGPAADVFSLGSLLYRAISGASAFEASSPLGVSIRLTMGRQTSIREHHVDIDSELQALITAMLTLKPEYRPSLSQVREVLGKHAVPRHELVRGLLDAGHAPSISGQVRVGSLEEPRSGEPPASPPSPSPSSPSRHDPARPPTGVALSTVDLPPPPPPTPAPVAVAAPRPALHAVDEVEEILPARKPPPPFVVDNDPTALSVVLPTQLQVVTPRARQPVRRFDTAEWLVGDVLDFPRTQVLEAPDRRPRTAVLRPPSLPTRPIAAPAPPRPLRPASLPPPVLPLSALPSPLPSTPPPITAPPPPRAEASAGLGGRAPAWAIWTAVTLGAFSLVVGATSIAMMLAVG